MEQTNSQLPTTLFDCVVVDQTFKGSDKFGNIRVGLPSPVIRQRGDGSTSSTNPKWSITVSADRNPEAFRIIKSAPFGVRLKIHTEAYGRGARVQSGPRNNRQEFTNWLSAHEAVAAENLGFPDDGSQVQAEQELEDALT